MSYCGLVDAKIRASDKDLPVIHKIGRCSHSKLSVPFSNCLGKKDTEL